jgi:hypothetical protein
VELEIASPLFPFPVVPVSPRTVHYLDQLSAAQLTVEATVSLGTDVQVSSAICFDINIVSDFSSL